MTSRRHFVNPFSKLRIAVERLKPLTQLHPGDIVVKSTVDLTTILPGLIGAKRMANPTQFYELIKELFLILDDGDRQLFNRFNLTATRYYALIHINEEPGISLSQLSNRLLCDKSNITRIIKSMEADGLVCRRRHKKDGRALQLFLTDYGQTVSTRAAHAHLTYNQFRFNDGEASGSAELVKALDSLKRQLSQRKQPPPGGPTVGGLTPGGSTAGELGRLQ
jgi:DNA-binding MarR family transcriptional regulator